MLKHLHRFIGPRTRVHYWSHSTPINTLRRWFSIEKPSAATLEDWDQWKHQTQRNHPLGYWLTEELIDNVQNAVMLPLDVLNACRQYCRHRFIAETHKLPSDLAPGEFHELDTRMLHCLFTALVDFVEIEKAHMQVVTHNDMDEKYKRPWFDKADTLCGRPWRCPQAGIDYLTWESGLKKEFYDRESGISSETDLPSDQAIAATEILTLYHWWKARATRPDPYELCDWNDRELTPDQKMQKSILLDKAAEIERQKALEDDEMLMRLIRIRRHLWT